MEIINYYLLQVFKAYLIIMLFAYKYISIKSVII